MLGDSVPDWDLLVTFRSAPDPLQVLMGLVLGLPDSLLLGGGLNHPTWPQPPHGGPLGTVLGDSVPDWDLLVTSRSAPDPLQVLMGLVLGLPDSRLLGEDWMAWEAIAGLLLSQGQF